MLKVMPEYRPNEISYTNLKTSGFFMNKMALVWVYDGEVYLWVQCCYKNIETPTIPRATLRTWIGVFTQNRLTDADLYEIQEAVEYAYKYSGGDAEVYVLNDRVELAEFILEKAKEGGDD